MGPACRSQTERDGAPACTRAGGAAGLRPGRLGPCEEGGEGQRPGLRRGDGPARPAEKGREFSLF